MLRITKACDPIEVRNLVTVIYAPPGVGKTSMASTAEAPLLIDFDRGAYRSKNRGDIVEVESWEDMVNMEPADLAGYKTLIVDTAGRALDCLTATIIQEDPKMGRGGGGLTISGYGVLKTRFTAFSRWVVGLGMDIVMVAHSDEQRGSGDEVQERLDVQGGSKGEIYKSADVMGRIYFERGRRMFNCSPTDVAFGKNPGGLPPLVIPDFSAEPKFLAGLITQIKATLNERNKQQATARTALDEWITRISAAVGLADFNALATDLKGIDKTLGKVVTPLVNKAAKANGLKFDAKAWAFVEAAVAA